MKIKVIDYYSYCNLFRLNIQFKINQLQNYATDIDVFMEGRYWIIFLEVGSRMTKKFEGVVCCEIQVCELSSIVCRSLAVWVRLSVKKALLPDI